MTPAQYKARYDSLPVYLGAGSPTRVQVNQYRLNPNNVKTAVRDAFLTMLAKKGIDRELTVETNTGIVKLDADAELTAANDAYAKKQGKGARRIEVTAVSAQPELELVDARGNIELGNVFRSLLGDRPDPGPTFIDTKRFVNFGALARYVFSGKGSPEACQIVLQLASAWGLAPDGLQKYADSAMGLDCNGFVGNYLWHEKRGRPWNDLGVGNLDLGPDAHIDEFCKGRGLTKWDDIRPSQMYVLGLVDASGQVMPGGPGATPGHMVITEPGRSRPATMVKGQRQPAAIRVVESTAAHSPGLWESWYSFVNVNSGIFTLNREDMQSSKQLNFKIVPVI